MENEIIILSIVVTILTNPIMRTFMSIPYKKFYLFIVFCIVSFLSVEQSIISIAQPFVNWSTLTSPVLMY